MKNVLELLTAANPVPPEIPLTDGFADPDRFRPLIEQRRESMQTLDREAPPRRSRLTPVLVGVAVVAVTVGIVAALMNDDSPVVGSEADIPSVEALLAGDPVPLTGATAVEVVETYLDRVNAGDLTGAVELFSVEYRQRPWTGIVSDGGGPARVVVGWTSHFVLLDGNFEYDCSEASTDLVVCSVTAADDLSRSMGIAAPTYEWELEVADGLIDRGLMTPPLSADGRPAGGSPYAEAVAEFDGWARGAYTDEFLEACRSSQIFPGWAPECARFISTHLSDFLAAR